MAILRVLLLSAALLLISGCSDKPPAPATETSTPVAVATAEPTPEKEPYAEFITFSPEAEKMAEQLKASAEGKSSLSDERKKENAEAFLWLVHNGEGEIRVLALKELDDLYSSDAELDDDEVALTDTYRYVVISALKTKDTTIQGYAIEATEACLEEEPPHKETLSGLAELAASSQEEGVLYMVAEILDETDAKFDNLELVQAYLQVLGSSSDLAKMQAMQYIVTKDRGASNELFEKLMELAGGEGPVAAQALRAAPRVAVDEEQRKSVIAAAERMLTSEDAFQRASALSALGKSAQKESAATIAKLLDDGATYDRVKFNYTTPTGSLGTFGVRVTDSGRVDDAAAVALSYLSRDLEDAKTLKFPYLKSDASEADVAKMREDAKAWVASLK